MRGMWFCFYNDCTNPTDLTNVSIVYVAFDIILVLFVKVKYVMLDGAPRCGIAMKEAFRSTKRGNQVYAPGIFKHG